MEFMFCETHLRVCKGNVLNLINTQFNFADQFEELICGPAELLSIYTYIYGHWPGFKSNYAKDLIKHFSIYIYISFFSSGNGLLTAEVCDKLR